MAGWHRWPDGRESGWTPGDGDGQGGLACCDSWGHKESDRTERLNWTEVLNKQDVYYHQCYHDTLYESIGLEGILIRWGIDAVSKTPPMKITKCEFLGPISTREADPGSLVSPCVKDEWDLYLPSLLIEKIHHPLLLTELRVIYWLLITLITFDALPSKFEVLIISKYMSGMNEGDIHPFL